MLVLTRCLGESVMIGNDMIVTVLDVKGGQVRIGIKAPSNIPIHREEIYDRIRTGGPCDSRRCHPKINPGTGGERRPAKGIVTGWPRRSF